MNSLLLYFCGRLVCLPSNGIHVRIHGRETPAQVPGRETAIVTCPRNVCGDISMAALVDTCPLKLSRNRAQNEHRVETTHSNQTERGHREEWRGHPASQGTQDGLGSHSRPPVTCQKPVHANKLPVIYRRVVPALDKTVAGSSGAGRCWDSLLGRWQPPARSASSAPGVTDRRMMCPPALGARSAAGGPQSPGYVPPHGETVWEEGPAGPGGSPGREGPCEDRVGRG